MAYSKFPFFRFPKKIKEEFPKRIKTEKEKKYRRKQNKDQKRKANRKEKETRGKHPFSIFFDISSLFCSMHQTSTTEKNKRREEPKKKVKRRNAKLRKTKTKREKKRETEKNKNKKKTRNKKNQKLKKSTLVPLLTVKGDFHGCGTLILSILNDTELHHSIRRMLNRALENIKKKQNEIISELTTENDGNKKSSQKTKKEGKKEVKNWKEEIER